VTAPGYNVPSSLNNKQLAGWMIDRTLLKSVFKNDTQYWAAFSGTSMAAPHVAGIVALLLQVNPNLTATQVKDILESSADADQSTGAVPNNTYGYGRVNAYSAIIRALQLSSVNSLNVLNTPAVYPNPASDVLTIAMPGNCSGKINICDMQGRVISELDVESDKKYQIDIQQLSQGIYIVNFRNGGELFAWKLVKN
jgi:subtilisin family serine protease